MTGWPYYWQQLKDMKGSVDVAKLDEAGLEIYLAECSARGPVTVDASDLPKPGSVVPGVDIRSSNPAGYASLPGRSMAGPHSARAMALLWSMDPSLVGDVERTDRILSQTAQRLTVGTLYDQGVPERGAVFGCGSDLPDDVPNQVYGWGQVDVWAAAQALLEGG